MNGGGSKAFSLRSCLFAMSAVSYTSERDEKEVDNLKSTKCEGLEQIVNVKRTKLSDFLICEARTIDPRKIRSECKIESNVNYDDICGIDIYPHIPIYDRSIGSLTPSWCTWRFVTHEDMTYLKKHQRNKNFMLSFFGNKILNGHSERNKDIFVQILWEFFKFARDHSFNEEAVSSTLGLVYLIHLFFLSYPWRTAKEIHEFFREITLLHAIMDPPKSSEVFTVPECKLLFEFFHKTYMENLVLLRIVCHPNYRLTMNLCTSNSEQRDE